MQTERLVLFAKRPRAGHVKTRLVPPLDAAKALALYEAFLHDQLALLERFASRCECELCVAGPWQPPAGMLTPKVRLTHQGDGDLGSRMLNCFRRSTRNGVERTVILGVDAPTLPDGHVRKAFDLLAGGSDAVVAPAADGGYVLIGLRTPIPALFRDITWGGPDVLRATDERAREARIRLGHLRPWYDVDDAEGLRRLRSDLQRSEAARRAPATARVLARVAP